MKTAFQSKNYGFASAICAVAATLAAFAVLPLSVAVSRRGDAGRTPKLARVYSAAQQRSDGGAKNAGASGRGASAGVPNFSGAKTAAEFTVPALDFSSVGVAVPDFGAGGNLAFDSFGGGLSDSETKFDAFELDALDKIPKRLNSVRIDYPRKLLDRGIEGEVLLNVVVDSDGSVEVESVAGSTDARFEKSAVDAASKLRYESPMKNGERVRARFVLPIPFKIVK